MKTAFAFFDVDGTVIAQDSFMLLVRKTLKAQPWRVLFFVLFCPVFVLTAIFKFDKQLAKSCTLWSLTVGRGRRNAVVHLRDAIQPELNALWFAEMGSTLAQLRSEGVHICYVSASGQVWVRALVNKKDPGPKSVLGSRLGFFAGGVVLVSPNCYGKQKLVRISQRLATQGLAAENVLWHSGYSDHRADLPMLTPCARRYLICPTEQNRVAYQTAFRTEFTELTWHLEKIES